MIVFYCIAQLFRRILYRDERVIIKTLNTSILLKVKSDIQSRFQIYIKSTNISGNHLLPRDNG